MQLIKVSDRPHDFLMSDSSSTLDLTIQSRSSTAPILDSYINRISSNNNTPNKIKQRSIGSLSKTLKSETNGCNMLLGGIQSRPIFVSENSSNFSIDSTIHSNKPKSIGKLSKGPSSRIRQALETESSISNFFIGNR